MGNSPRSYLFRESDNAPLVVFRILFGALMLFSTLRFMVNGWIETLYLQPTYHFTYYGFDWVRPLSGAGMYLLYIVLAISALGILLGAFYRISSLLFFLGFTYVELIDKTYYLNHYYFVSLVAFLLIWVPAHRRFSLDVKWGRVTASAEAAAWQIDIFRFQLGVVYFFAGIAKINADWLLEAMPLKVWLQAFDWWPVVGSIIANDVTAYVFSWAGMLYDVSIVFFLLWSRTRTTAYIAVILFHALTALLFPIGVFPWVMIFLTWIFFSPRFHQRLLQFLGENSTVKPSISLPRKQEGSTLISAFLSVWVGVQLLVPLRFMAYPGPLFWTEEGYRFSWRVMLMEKTGSCTFLVKEATEQKEMGSVKEVDNLTYLTPLQERMMATQPDMILQFAHFLQGEFEKEWGGRAQVYADCRVSLQGRRNQAFVDSNVDLTTKSRGFLHFDWIKGRDE